MGNSIVVVHNDRGGQLLDSVKEQLSMVQIKMDDIIKYNESLINPFPAGRGREDYFREAEKKGYIRPLIKCFQTPVYKKIIRKVKSVVKGMVR